MQTEPCSHEAAKRYFAEIMMPFRAIIEKNLAMVKKLDVKLIAPSHGAIYDLGSSSAPMKSGCPRPPEISWSSYITMHGSTAILVNRLVGAPRQRVRVEQFNSGL